MLLWVKYLPHALLVLALGLLGWAYSRDRRLSARQEILLAQIASLDSAKKVLTSQIRAVDVSYKTDTLRLTKTLTQYRAHRDTLRLTDTLQVKVVLAQADTAISACLSTLKTCEVRIAQRDSMIRFLEQQRKAERQLRLLPARRLGSTLELGYDLANAAILPRASLELRTFWRVNFFLAVEVPVTRTGSDAPGARALVGLKRSF